MSQPIYLSRKEFQVVWLYNAFVTKEFYYQQLCCQGGDQSDAVTEDASAEPSSVQLASKWPFACWLSLGGPIDLKHMTNIHLQVWI